MHNSQTKESKEKGVGGWRRTQDVQPLLRPCKHIRSSLDRVRRRQLDMEERSLLRNGVAPTSAPPPPHARLAPVVPAGPVDRALSRFFRMGKSSAYVCGVKTRKIR